MNAIQNVFQQAQLAEAAYSNFGGMNIDTPKSVIVIALTTGDGKFSLAQATAFVDQWQVIDHIPDTIAGFSATIFRNTQTGAYNLAIRGSTPANYALDFLADAALIVNDGVAVGQLVDLYNFWQRATTRAGLTYVAAKLVPYFSPLTPVNAIQVGNSDYGIVFTNSSELADVTLRTATGAIPTGLGALTVAGHSLGGHLAMDS